MPKVTEAHTRARRQQILDAAVSCFARKGYHSSTIQDICREAGLSPGAVYSYYKGKQALLEAVIETTTEEIDAITSALDKPGDLVTLLRSAAQVTFGHLDNAETLPRLRTTVVIMAEALRDRRIGDAFASEVRYLLAGLKRFVRRAQAQGEIDPSLDPEQVGRLLFSVFEGFKQQKIIEPKTDTMTYLGTLIPVLVRGLAPPLGARQYTLPDDDGASTIK